MMKKLRRIWRAVRREPVLFDGFYVAMRCREPGVTFKQALQECAAMNTEWLLSWHRGE